MHQPMMRLYRVAKVSTHALWASAGFDLDPEIPIDKVKKAFTERYSPFAPRLAVFWQKSMMNATVIGIEVMGFTVESSDEVPRAGLVSCDPINSSEINKIDGALRSELERMNIWTEPKEYEWRAWYTTGDKK